MKSCWIYCGAPTNNLYIKPPDNSLVIAADRGYDILKQIGVTPDILLGDFDSITETIPNNCQIIKASTEKDDTDTMLAVKKALSLGCNDITLVASIGGRLDHTFANIQTLAYISNNGATGKLIGDTDLVYFCEKGKFIFPKIENMYFSVFTYTKESKISLKGTKYTLNNYCLTNSFPLGISNEIIEKEAILTNIAGQIIIIFSKK